MENNYWGDFIANVINWFISAGFMWWGWSVLAPELNAPEFTYWEIFAIRMMVSNILSMVWNGKYKSENYFREN